MARHSQPEHIRVEVEAILAKSLRAILVLVDDEEHWIPLSQIQQGRGMPALLINNGPTAIWITPWIAQQRGLEETL